MDKIKYIITNLSGFKWVKQNDGVYLVNPSFEEEFKKLFSIFNNKIN